MWLEVSRPGFRSCDDCQKWMYEDPGSEMSSKRALRRGEFIARPAGVPTPCWKCPKCEGSAEKTPTTGRQSDLSDKNRRTLELYYETQAAHLPISDPVTVKNLGIVHDYMKAHERMRTGLG